MSMSPYEVLYKMKHRPPRYWDKVELVSYWCKKKKKKKITQDRSEEVAVIQLQLATAQSRQKGYVNARRQELEFEVDTKFSLKNHS